MIVPYFEDDLVTIYHADAREVLPQLASASVDFIFTDPPYGHNNNDGDLIQNIERAIPARKPKYLTIEQATKSRPIANDGKESDGLVRWAFGEFKRLLREEGCCCCCCCCGGGGPDPQFARWSLWLDEALTFKQMIVWDKGPMGLGWHYRRSYETVLVAHKGEKCHWYDTTDKVENIIRNIPKIIPQADEHPTPKPERLIKFFMQIHSKPGDLVLDPFMGAGSTLRAAKDLGRRCIGIEIDEYWCQVAAKRMSQIPMPLWKV